MSLNWKVSFKKFFLVGPEKLFSTSNRYFFKTCNKKMYPQIPNPFY